MNRAPYSAVRHLMKPGDILAFGGKGNISNFIKFAIRSPVSHVGIVMQTNMSFQGETNGSKRFFNNLIESTSLNGQSGVQIHRISDRLAETDGQVWWLPLSSIVRKRLNLDAFYNFLLEQNGKAYDTVQAVKSGIDLDVFGRDQVGNEEDFSKLFCSELCAAALEVGGVIDTINASEVTPKDLVQFQLYMQYAQLLGEPCEIPGFNTKGYEGFGVD